MARSGVLTVLAITLSFLALLGPACCEQPIIVEGKVYCDTCRLGCVHRATEYIADGKVKIECKSKETNELVYTIEGKTDENGLYRLPVEGEHQNDRCEVILVSSPRDDCNEVEHNRDRAPIPITMNNGIVSSVRHGNEIGYLKTTPLPVCEQIKKELGQ